MIQFPQINDINQNVTVTATGSGEATVTVPVIDCCVYWYLPFESDQVLKVSALCWPPLFSVWQMVSLYYALPKEKESDCQTFSLSLQLIPGQINYIHMGMWAPVNRDDFFITSPVCYKQTHPSSLSILGHLSAFSYLSFGQTLLSEIWTDWMVKKMLSCLQIKEMKLRGCTSWE